MPVIFIPPQLRALTEGTESVEVEAKTIAAAIAELDDRYPGIRNRLCEGDDLKPGLAVSVDGNVSTMGMFQKLTADSEVHFLPAIGGGC